jgi:hypothetical protein
LLRMCLQTEIQPPTAIVIEWRLCRTHTKTPVRLLIYWTKHFQKHSNKNVNFSLWKMKLQNKHKQ